MLREVLIDLRLTGQARGVGSSKEARSGPASFVECHITAGRRPACSLDKRGRAARRLYADASAPVAYASAASLSSKTKAVTYVEDGQLDTKRTTPHLAAKHLRLELLRERGGAATYSSPNLYAVTTSTCRPLAADAARAFTSRAATSPLSARTSASSPRAREVRLRRRARPPPSTTRRARRRRARTTTAPRSSR